MYNKNTINNINLDEFKKTLNGYMTTHNKKFDYYFIRCEFTLQFDNNFTENIKTFYLYNADVTNLKRYLLKNIYYFTSKGYTVSNINQATFYTIIDINNIAYNYYINQPMHSVERQINMIIAENPQLIISLDRSKNHPLIRKYSPIPFNS